MTTESATGRTLQVRVVKKRHETLDICSFELQALDGAPLPAFSAGAHVDVHVKPGLIRQYSLCNNPQEKDRYLICVLRDPNTRGGSQAMHDAISEGQVIAISEPRNLFHLIPGPHATLLLAGGIGITPLLAMAWHLFRQKADFHLHYFTRSPERTAFLDMIGNAPIKQHISFWFDSAPAGERPAIPALLSAASRESHIYTCGPAGFLKHVLSTTEAQGWPADRVHHEAFSAQPLKADAQSGAQFAVQIRSSGQTVQVLPGETIVAALAKHGVDIPVSCEQGICGTCLTGVLDGKPDHRDQYLTDEEHARCDRLTPCCSRSLSPLLVLDL